MPILKRDWSGADDRRQGFVVATLSLGRSGVLIYVRRMRPNKFIAHYERQLGRPLTIGELAKVDEARSITVGKRDSVKAMRQALLSLTPHARPGYREIELIEPVRGLFL